MTLHHSKFLDVRIMCSDATRVVRWCAYVWRLNVLECFGGERCWKQLLLFIFLVTAPCVWRQLLPVTVDNLWFPNVHIR